MTTTATTWTEDSVVALLKQSDKAVERGLRRIHEYQTAAEQASGTTHVENGVGFNKLDAAFAKSLLEWREAGRNWTAKQTAAARKIALRYRKQLVRIANGQQ